MADFWRRRKPSSPKAWATVVRVRDQEIKRLRSQLKAERHDRELEERMLRQEIRTWRHSAIRHREDFERAAIERDKLRAKLKLRDEFIICHAAAYPDPLDVYPPTIENARQSARLLKPDPDYGRVVIKHRVVSEWEDVEV